MTHSVNSGNRQTGFPIWLTVKAGLLAGLLDISFAFLYSYIKRGTYPSSVLKYIAEKVFGKQAFTNSTLENITGLLVHFAIAMCWSFLFFILYRTVKIMQRNMIITGILYGLFVWAMMNMVLLPAWNNKAYLFNAESSIINAVILIIAIGLPLSLIAKQHYQNNSVK